MSSYLTFYGVPKVKEENQEAKPITIVSFSRNNDIYSYFNDNCNIPYAYSFGGDSDEEKFGEVTIDDVEIAENDVKEDISRSEKRLHEYEKYAHENSDCISEILSIKEYLEDLYRALHYIEFIGHIVYETRYDSDSHFSKILANVD